MRAAKKAGLLSSLLLLESPPAPIVFGVGGIDDDLPKHF
jgi:hypothetical protein